MKDEFSKKYHDYCKARGTSDEIFGMTQRVDESLEYYIEWSIHL